jgi:hypothetical protein
MATLTQGETYKTSLHITDATAAELRYGGPKAGTSAMVLTGGEWTGSLDTTTLEPGLYTVQVWATYADGSKKIPFAENFKLLAGLKAGDMRSKNVIALENLDAMLTGRASDGVKSYKINNRELYRYDMGEIIKLRNHFAHLVQKENRRAQGKSSLGPRIEIRF